MRCGTVILTMGYVMLLSGCASLNPMPFGAEQLQQDALARWQQCLDRHRGAPQPTKVSEAASKLRSRCDGHRRDVLMSFPETLEPQLDAMLHEQIIRSAFGDSFNGHIGLPAGLPSGTAIQSVR